MRKFVVSDLHGDGIVYKSIMSYLDNIKKEEDIELYINGDLIDRGLDSASMLLDIKRRIEEGERITYLAGNHELMMYEVFEKRKKEIYVPTYNDWFLNGGLVTDDDLAIRFDYDKDKILEVVDFISNLKIYHKFPETIDYKNIVLVHASCPIFVKDECDIRIKDNDPCMDYSLWARVNNPGYHFRCRIGHDSYITIVGHTPNDSKYGVVYNIGEDYLNIDGGSAYYVSGYFEEDHVPLVEVCDNYLKILTFNHNNEIIYGNYLVDAKLKPFSDEELDKARSYLDKSYIPKRLIKLPDKTIVYEDY